MCAIDKKALNESGYGNFYSEFQHNACHMYANVGLCTCKRLFGLRNITFYITTKFEKLNDIRINKKIKLKRGGIFASFFLRFAPQV